MPPKKAVGEDGASASSGGPTMTEGEMKFIKVMFDNMIQRPDADWDKVATDLGLKDSKCAKERFRQMSVKHGWREGPANATTPRKPKAAAAPKGKVTKPKTPRKTPAKKSKAKAVDTSDEDEEMVDLKDEEDDNLKVESQEEAAQEANCKDEDEI